MNGHEVFKIFLGVMCFMCETFKCTILRTNISHLGKRNIIDWKVPLKGDIWDMLVGMEDSQIRCFQHTYFTRNLGPKCVPPVNHTNSPSTSPSNHQTFQVPKMKVLTYISCISSAYVRGNVTPKIAGYKVQEPSNLGTWNVWWSKFSPRRPELVNGLVMIGHKQDTDSEDESGDLRVQASGLGGPRLGFGWGRVVGLKMSYGKKTGQKPKGSLHGFCRIFGTNLRTWNFESMQGCSFKECLLRRWWFFWFHVSFQGSV